jgi:hypothetical protein
MYIQSNRGLSKFNSTPSECVESYTADRPTNLTTLPAANAVSRPEAVAAQLTGPARLSFACQG